jgi:hypothetical protein
VPKWAEPEREICQVSKQLNYAPTRMIVLMRPLYDGRDRMQTRFCGPARSTHAELTIVSMLSERVEHEALGLNNAMNAKLPPIGLRRQYLGRHIKISQGGDLFLTFGKHRHRYYAVIIHPTCTTSMSDM